MTNQVEPERPAGSRAGSRKGLSLEVHTLTHPCPCLQKGDFAEAARTYHGCVDLMNQVPGNTPVAFRMPCCDSMNTVSPRFFAEIFNKTSPGGKFLSIDSSVFTVLTPDDPSLPRDLVFDADGKERFRKYIPFPSFVNTIENYPYPYVIGGTCWEFPCIVPSDWEAQNIHKPGNPRTLEDMKAALDCVVRQARRLRPRLPPLRLDQDRAGRRAGRLRRQEVWQEGQVPERSVKPSSGLNKNLLKGHPLRPADGTADPQHGRSSETSNPNVSLPPGHPHARRRKAATPAFGSSTSTRTATLDVVFSNDQEYGIYLFDSPKTKGWTRKVMAGKAGEPGALPKIVRDGTNNGFFVHSRSLWWQNEDTARLPDLVDRRSFNDLLKDVEPRGKSPEASLKSIRVDARIHGRAGRDPSRW